MGTCVHVYLRVRMQLTFYAFVMNFHAKFHAYTFINTNLIFFK